ncbi:MAG: SxtJ family membrane protein [Planctomycetota bacterium]|jgi:hypothetical protein
MALIRINRNPSAGELRWFGLIVLAFFGVVGGLVLWQTGSRPATAVLWAIGAAGCLVYYAVGPLRRPMYLGWMHAVYPIGWTVSHLVLAATYYLVLTPIGLVMRLLGRDAMKRRLEPQARTYWVEHDPAEPARYFRQF